MKTNRIVMEFRQDDELTMCWQRMDGGKGAVFELLGRAFEAAERETGDGVRESLVAFFRGAVLRKGDLEAVLERME